ncbi:MAG: VWA domain-containing protein [Saprospiraceae bacterium]
MNFAQPFWLLLLLVLPLLVRRQHLNSGLSLRLSQTGKAGGNWRTETRTRLPVLRWLALTLLIVAMARPQRHWQEEKVQADGVDIMLALDISPSMLSKDFDPDRLAVAKRVAIEFVEKRPYDRLGLVAFSAEAFTQCPLTTDRHMVQKFIRDLQLGRLQDGTAIGLGLATAVNRLKDSPARSKVVILLTDGENNAGDEMRPMRAAEIAKALGVRVYTVGIGTDGIVLSPAQRNPDGSYEFAPRPMTFDTELLRQIAAATQGKFYRAYSEDDLEGIYAEIDQLEKTKVEVTTVSRTQDWFQWLIALAVVVLLLEMLLRWGLLRSVTPG